MKFLSHFDFIALVMTPVFWTGVATMCVVTLVTYWLLSWLVSFLRKGIKRWGEVNAASHRIRFILGEILNRTSNLLLFVAAFLFSLRFVNLPDNLYNTISHAWFLVLAFQMALWLDQAVVSWLRHIMRQPGMNKNPVTLVITGLIFRAVVWSVMLLSILANVGVNITALVASLGVGGIAIALAIQTILSDVFASLSIGFDKPFEIGDFVVFNDVAGTVEHIGLKTTRIRSLSGEQIVCGNAILLQQTLHNYKRMQTRRIVFNFGIAINTPPEKLRIIGDLVKEIIIDIGETKFDRAHLLGFGTDRLNIEVVHIVNTADYNKYMDIQQEINIRIIEKLIEHGIEMALPNMIVRTQAEPENGRLDVTREEKRA
ncbi:mechanosensitive ion channel family protein [Rahnella sp. SL6]|uniref:mechanosensitive ion channel family protein n=1 Tax=Rahnella perminowiae TaxID=2816244 RepID=UPI001C256FD5|nr:mechanosensitive ion channel family protein [Rahnella perminowiae]MBU9811153.1 mechanosensitive ion channel family protein [Rahnella perminowiae]MBU9827379.1 mechanosensitive ion channel family protein [Rahnella perminowiae]MCR9003384.1 mechanosensitive ion channel family protein [Rahnella perminowiae]